MAFAQEREQAFDPAKSRLVHGDAHAHNALYNADNQIRLIDPDGLLAEPACDLAVLMREWNDDLLVGDVVALGQARCQMLASLTNVPERAIWQWELMERVSTGLVFLQIGMEYLGRETLAIADPWSLADLAWNKF